nr:hypothetical protein [Tanacetum cinerariifolium]
DQEDERDDDEDDEEKGNDDEQAFDEEESIHPSLSTHAEEEPRDEESFDPIPKTPKDTDDEGNGEENLGLNVGREEGHDEEEEVDELYRNININQGMGMQTTQEVEDSHVTLTSVNLDEESIHPSLSTHAEEEPRDEESFDPIPKTPKDTDDEGNGEENLSLNVGREEGHDEEEEEEDKLYKDINVNQGRGIQMNQEVKDSHVTLTPFNPDGQQQSSFVSSQFVTSMLNLTLDAGMESIFETTSQMDVPTLPTTSPSTLLQDLPNFGSLFGFDHRLKTLEANFFEFMQTNQFAGAISTIPWIVQRYMDQRMNEAVQV